MERKKQSNNNLSLLSYHKMVTETYNDGKDENNQNVSYYSLPGFSLFLIFLELDLHGRKDYFIASAIRNNQTPHKYIPTKW